MQPIESFEQARLLWSMGRTRESPAFNNFFLSRSSIERAVRKKYLCGIATPGASIITRHDRDFCHLYLHYSDPEAGKALLTGLDTSTTYVLDVVHRADSHLEMVALLLESGFQSYRRLERLQRPIEKSTISKKSLEVEYALDSDSEPILSDLEIHFDRFSEQLPDLDEINDAVSNRQILVVRRNDQLAGFLFFEGFNRSSTLRYWFVNPRFRDGLIGSSLIRHYLTVSCSSGTSQLWVMVDNEDAIQKYNHYGYASSGLQDLVMKRN